MTGLVFLFSVISQNGTKGSNLTLIYIEMIAKKVFIDKLQETFVISSHILSYYPVNQQTDLDICGAGVCVGNWRFEH